MSRCGCQCGRWCLLISVISVLFALGLDDMAGNSEATSQLGTLNEPGGNNSDGQHEHNMRVKSYRPNIA